VLRLEPAGYCSFMCSGLRSNAAGAAGDGAGSGGGSAADGGEPVGAGGEARRGRLGRSAEGAAEG
jgi:hypothetical protein